MKKIFTIIMLASLLILTACYLPARKPAENAGSIQTSIAQTVEVRQTQIAFETLVSSLTAQPTQTILPGMITPVATNTIVTTYIPSTSTPIPASCDWAAYVDDISIPDGTLLLPGQDFTKTWRLKNIGTCTWSPEYSIVFMEGSSLGAPASVKLNNTVVPGSTIDVSVTMKAPNIAGSYTSNWLLKNTSGNTFGLGTSVRAYFWVKI